MNTKYTPRELMTGACMRGGIEYPVPVIVELGACGHPLKGLPMYLVGKSDVCYSCHLEMKAQERLAAEIVAANAPAFAELRDGLTKLSVSLTDDPEGVGEWLTSVSELTALAYGDADLGTHTIIEGGDVLELGSHKSELTDDEIPL